MVNKDHSTNRSVSRILMNSDSPIEHLARIAVENPTPGNRWHHSCAPCWAHYRWFAFLSVNTWRWSVSSSSRWCAGLGREQRRLNPWRWS